MPLHQAQCMLSRRRFLQAAAVGAAGVAGAFALGGCTPKARSAISGTREGEVPRAAYEFTQKVAVTFNFNTVVTLKASCSQELLDAAVARCNYFESILSPVRETSDVCRINAAAGAPVQVAPETAELVACALQYCRATQGAFDITIGAASKLWNFATGVVPSESALVEAAKHINYEAVRVQGNTVQLANPAAQLDLGGIAKGYIADDLAALFLEAGCNSATIDIGGNVKVVGVRPDGRLWQAGVGNPADILGSVVATTTLQDASLVTSSITDQAFKQAGKRYWHILNPRTGQPLETNLQSVTILSERSIDGDGYTIGLMALGREKAVEFLDERAELEGLVVDEAGEIMQSKGNVFELV